MTWLRRRLPDLLELLALTGLAVAQPVLDVFGKSADTFVAQGAGTADIVGFAAAVTLVPAVALWGLELAVAGASARAARWLHLGLVALLVAMIAVEVGKRVTDLGYKRLSIGAAVLGLAAAALLAHVSVARAWLRLLAAAPFAFAGLFLFATPVADVAGPSSAVAEDVDVDRPAPVVMVVFDELPLASLLDGTGAVNREVFPNFAALADGSSWYRNNTTVAPNTTDAVPAILTGRYPEGTGSAPVSANYPENLFTLLGGTYDLHATEPVTRLCRRSCVTPDDGRDASALGSLLGDAVDVWGDLAQPKRVLTNVGSSRGLVTDLRAGERFEDFVGSLATSRRSRPRLDFLHVLLPHTPFRLLPSGSTYDGADPPAGFFACCWMDQPSADSARQRHLLQLQHTDDLLGRLIDRMKQLGTWDDSLVVVTADHGASFVGGEPARGLSRVNHPDILWTPLFVKAPGQRGPTVSDQPSRSIDVVPTVADHLGVALPWDLDGRSALDTRAAAATDDERRALRWAFNTLEPTDGNYLVFDGRAGYETALGMAPELGAGEGVERLFRIGRYGDLVGTRLDELAVGEAAPVTGRLEDPDRFEDVDPGASEVPAYVAGEIESDEVVALVVSVNGVIGGWSDTTVNRYPDREAAAAYGVEVPAGAERVRRFSTLVPEELLRPGDNDVRLFVVDRSGGRGAGASVTLAPVPLDR